MSKAKPIHRKKPGHGKGHVAARVVVTLVTSAIGLFLGSWIIPGVHVSGFWEGHLAAAILGALNALVWPAVIRFALPFTAWTLGIGALVLNGLFVWIVGWILGSGFQVDR